MIKFASEKEKDVKSCKNDNYLRVVEGDSIEKFYVDFLINLREGHSLPQNIIQTITSGLKSLVELIHELLKMQTKNSLIKYQRMVTTTSAKDDSILLTIVNSIQQILSKHDVLTMLTKKFNENVNRNAIDTDLIFNNRHELHAKQYPVLKNKPDALLFQLYIDEIGLINPIGAKKDTQKITMIYVQL